MRDKPNHDLNCYVDRAFSDRGHRCFCCDTLSGTVSNFGVAASVLEHRRYGYQFGAAVTGRDGEIVFGEDDNSGHLWLYFPKVLARQSQ